MQRLVKQIHKLLLKKAKTVAVAESCTGGLVCNLLTQSPGSSQYFILGVVAYSNKTKRVILKIPRQVIAKKGAVSRIVAKLMAKSVRLIAKTDFGLGITGIAGPGGSSKEKPVGTVFIAVDSKKRVLCKKFIFRGSRLNIRKMAALKSLELLKKIL